MKQCKTLILLGLLVCFCGMINAAMVHEYTFNVDGQANDSVGGADLTLNGSATVSGGALVLPGGGTRVNNAIALGAALTELAATINGANGLTMEVWFTQNANNDWSKLFMAGGTGYMDITPRRGADGNVSSCSFNDGPNESNARLTNGTAIANDTAYYIAAVWDETNNTIRIFLAEADNPDSALTMTGSMGGKDLAAIGISEFYLGSAVGFGDSDFNGQIDVFRIYDSAFTEAELEASYEAGPIHVKAANPDPGNGDTLIELDTQLNWTAPPTYTPVGYNIYIGTDPNVDTGQALGYTGTTIDPATELGVSFVNDTDYFWRVDALEPNSPNPIAHTGVLWSFTTTPLDPVVTGDPISQTVPAGTTIELSVTALNTVTYTWHRSDDEILDPQTDPQVGSGQTISVVINGIDEEALYYCVVSSQVGSDQSLPARILTERLVAYWDFEGDLDDGVADIVSGAPVHNGTAPDPNFVDGVPVIGGQAYLFSGDTGGVVTVADSVDYFNFYPQGMTISCWVKGQNPAIWDTIVSKESDREIAWNLGKGFFLARSDGGNAVFAARPSEAFGGTFPVDGWHQLVGVHDPAANAMRVYVDGALTTTLENVNPANWNAPNSAPLIFGAESTDGTIGTSSATIDDLKIWNYAMDSIEIAQQYVDLMGGYICVGGNPAADLSGDCQVTLDDLQILAENWLENNRVE